MSKEITHFICVGCSESYINPNINNENSVCNACMIITSNVITFLDETGERLYKKAIIKIINDVVSDHE